MTSPSRSVFRQSLPVLITSFVNKSGSIGISLLPILLVEGKYSTQECSWAMSAVKITAVVSTLASGWSCDRLGLRRTALLSFLLAGVGLGLLPLQRGFILLVVAGVLAQAGAASTNASVRLLLTRFVERRHQKEALGWLRSVNNLGQILSFGLASVSALLGAQLLIAFDSLTSFLAFGVGLRLLPHTASSRENKTPAATPEIGHPKGWWPLIGATGVLFAWNFVYEFFTAGIAGKLKVVFPVEGLRIFSGMMVLNTILCAAFAVGAARVLHRVVPTLIVSSLLTAAAISLGVYRADSVPILFAAILLMTLAEIGYGAFAQFLVIRSVPASNRENTVYSGAILLANFGKVTAAAVAFPWIVHASHPTQAVLAATLMSAVSIAVLVAGGREFRRISE